MNLNGVSISELADLSLSGKCLTEEQCHDVLGCPDENLMLLLHEAYRVRREYFGNHVHRQVLRSAKDGLGS